MTKMKALLVIVVMVISSVSARASSEGGKITNVEKMKEFLSDYNEKAIKDENQHMDAYWNRVTDITNDHINAENKAFIESTKFWREMNKKANTFEWEKLEDKTMKRQFSLLSESGISILSNDNLEKYTKLDTSLQSMFSLAKVCNTVKNKTNCMKLTPGLTNFMATSRDYKELKWAWNSWRNVSGKGMKSDYEKLVKLLNKSAKLNGYDDEGARWRSLYESPTFRKDMQHLYDQLKPFYEQLHAYVKRALMKVYGNDVFPASGHIPANILGNMWAQQWGNIEDLVTPYPKEPKLDVTSRMIKKGYKVKDMFEMAENFFVSLGLSKMTNIFWDKSMITRPKGKNVICHPSAEDFYRENDFRIKMCAEVKFEDLVTIHHEMGHIEYFMSYSKQPFLFRTGANAGFHEAIGNVMSLSVSTPGHLKKIGILEKIETTEEYDINFLIGRALDTLAFLPFGFMIDQWRWDVFDGSVPSDRYNEHWWALRCKYQGIYPPVAREADDFDPGAKFHVAANVAYIRYFVAYVIEYQFHKALCDESGHKGKLHKCDIFGSAKAGTKLRKMLELGASKPWQEAMMMMDGTKTMDASSIIEYFEPLMSWLKEKNRGHKVGWEEGCPRGSFVDDGNRGTNLLASIVTVSLTSLLYVFLL